MKKPQKLTRSHIPNPTGRNQFEGNRATKPISLRLSKDLDLQVREAAALSGVKLTYWIEQAIDRFLDRENISLHKNELHQIKNELLQGLDLERDSSQYQFAEKILEEMCTRLGGGQCPPGL